MNEPAATYWSVVKPMFHKVDTGHGVERYLSSIAAQPAPGVLLYAAHMCLAEIHNGGFLQLFWNLGGVMVPEAIDGFVTLEMPEMAGLLRETAAMLGRTYPRDRDARWDALINASMRSEADMARIMAEVSREAEPGKELVPAVKFYRVFVKATEPLGFDRLNERAWMLASEENGGFNAAADRYVEGMPLVN